MDERLMALSRLIRYAYNMSKSTGNNQWSHIFSSCVELMRRVIFGELSPERLACLDKWFSKYVPEVQLDGGAGSGNWGHKGVPGQLGGSAPGGGSRNRKGTLESGYTSEAKERARAKDKDKVSVTGGSSSGSSGSESSGAKTIHINKKGAATPAELGWNKSEYKKVEAKYMREHGIEHTWDISLHPGAEREIADEYSKSLPRHVETKDSDYIISSFDRVGGQTIKEGTVKGITKEGKEVGYTVGESYALPEQYCQRMGLRKGTTGTINNIHIFPNRQCEANARYNKSSNSTGDFTIHYMSGDGA